MATTQVSPTSSQQRVLSLVHAAGGRWVHLRQLDRSALLREQDFPTIPSIIENGWADLWSDREGGGMVRLSALGRKVEWAHRSLL